MTWTPPVYEDWEDGDFVFDDMLKMQVLDNLAYLLAAVNSAVGVGTIILSGRASIPAGFLACDGASLIRGDYPELFAAIGTAFNPLADSTHFNVPDLRRRFPIGKGATGPTATLGAIGGAFGHSHTLPNTQSAGGHGHAQGNTGDGGNHKHTNADAAFSGVITSLGAVKFTNPGGHVFDTQGGAPADAEEHVHQIPSHAHNLLDTSLAGTHAHNIPDITTLGGAHVHGFLVSTPTGSGDPPWLAVNYFIRAQSFGEVPATP